MSNSMDKCHQKETIDPEESPMISALMFGTGVFGNVAALVILEIRRRRESTARDVKRSGLFHIFITSLVVTDLTGTCLITPIVQVSYALNKTLDVMGSPYRNTTSMCQYFGVSMTFFSLATMSLLLATALDRCFAIGYPYLYNRRVTKKWAYVAIPVMFLISILFCLLPFVGFGIYVQYCPGTWCFIDMNPNSQEDHAFASLYATVMLVLVLTIVACNGFVVFHLYKMYKRRNRRGSVMMSTRSSSERRTMSMVTEVEHLILMVIMTIIFLVCTLPLVIRVYINSLSKEESHSMDLRALRFISVNSIIDPWVFIILSPGVGHFFRVHFCKTPLKRFRGSSYQSSLAKDNGPSHLELPHATPRTQSSHFNEHV